MYYISITITIFPDSNHAFIATTFMRTGTDIIRTIREIPVAKALSYIAQHEMTIQEKDGYFSANKSKGIYV